MERYMDIFTKLAFVLLASWVILAGLGMTDMPGSRHKAMSKGKGRGCGCGTQMPKAKALVTSYAENTGYGNRLSNM